MAVPTQNELNASLALADQLRPVDGRLEPLQGTFIEVELRSGTKPDVLDQKTQSIRSGAVKADAQNDRTVALYVPDASRLVFQQILDDYLNGPLTERAQSTQSGKGGSNRGLSSGATRNILDR